jgi:hypothetical protein
MRVLVCGGRNFRNSGAVFDALDDIDKARPISVIIEGGQRKYEMGRIVGGADFWAFKWANSRCRRKLRFRAEWREYGRAAGPMRNQRMLDEGKPDMVVAFPGGDGTADMVARARAAAIEVMEIAG